MTLPLYYYVLSTPLGVLGLVRWSFWLVRRIPAVLYRPVVSGRRLSISVTAPVYQEDPVVFAAAIESWLRNRVDEVILVIDVSDTVCQEVARRYPVTVITTDVPGKRDALRRGWNRATTELVALVDSDTVWADDVATEVCKPFADPRIGGVGTRQSVYQGKGFLSRITDMFLDHRYFDENASQSFLGRAVSCLSGRTAVYRRALLCEIEHDFMHETFWGVPCLSGDDKRLTTLIMERGHLTFMQRSAEVWSTFPTTWKIFFKQRLRWARNTWRSDVRALSHRWVYRHPFLAFTMVDKAISSFTLLIGPTFMILAVVHQNWLFVGVLAAWWQLSRSAKLLPHLRRRPSSFFFILGYVAVSWIMAGIKLHALLTIRKQRWLTRQVAVENGVVVRTEEAADDVPSVEAPGVGVTQPVPAASRAGVGQPPAGPAHVPAMPGPAMPGPLMPGRAMPGRAMPGPAVPRPPAPRAAPVPRPPAPGPAVPRPQVPVAATAGSATSRPATSRPPTPRPPTPRPAVPDPPIVDHHQRPDEHPTEALPVWVGRR